MKRDTVIFDFFGGVITSSPFEAFNRLEDERGIPRDFIRRVNSLERDRNAWARSERAEIDAATFDLIFAAEARALGHDLRGEDVLAVLAGDVRPRMAAALGWLKGNGYRIGCITNNVPTGKGARMARTVEKAEAIAAILVRFDHVVESSKVGIRKPDPAIYRMACEALGVVPEQCIYLDDLGINCKPAVALGMAAIKVISGDQALADLESASGLRRARWPDRNECSGRTPDRPIGRRASLAKALSRRGAENNCYGPSAGTANTLVSLRMMGDYHRRSHCADDIERAARLSSRGPLSSHRSDQKRKPTPITP